jgi:voltage-gated potassium channel
MMARAKQQKLRRRVFEILEHGPVGDRLTRIVSACLITLIVINLIAVTLGSVPEYAGRYGRLFIVIELISVSVFALEYAARIWAAPEHEAGGSRNSWRTRLAYARSFNGIVDLIAILPFVVGFFVPADLRAILVFRIFRFLKLARYSVGVRSLLDAMYEERRPLAGCLLIFAGAALVAASMMYLAEGSAQPEKFGSIPAALWWAVATLGTTGYGDVVPITPLGKVINGLTIMCALVMIALPVGIVATAFSQQVRRRDFVVTWGMVARVPLFSGLDADEIAAITRLLRTETVEEGAVIVRRGDPAHSMYFIAAGEVAIDLPESKDKEHLGPGHFFGEVAVLRRAKRSATITAVVRTNLLVLEADDLRALMEHDRRIAERIRKMTRDRLGHELVTKDGDIVSEELEENGKTGGRRRS